MLTSANLTSPLLFSKRDIFIRRLTSNEPFFSSWSHLPSFLLSFDCVLLALRLWRFFVHTRLIRRLHSKEKELNQRRLRAAPVHTARHSITKKILPNYLLITFIHALPNKNVNYCKKPSKQDFWKHCLIVTIE